MQQVGEIFDDKTYNAVFDTWYRRIRWVYACRPPQWRIAKYRRWLALYDRVNAAYDSYFYSKPYSPGRG